MNREQSPRGLRTHIAVVGRCNVGKSSLVNALAGQSVAIVSDVAGTTTDAVSKSMELRSLGAVVLTDTAGFDDLSPLGKQRVAESRRVAEKCDMAIVVCNENGDYTVEQEWVAEFDGKGVPVVVVLTKSDQIADAESAVKGVENALGRSVVTVSATSGEGIEALLEALQRALPNEGRERTITGNLVEAGDVVVLVMPQDKSAPKGRLILPQVQTIRELLDKRCIPVCCQPEELESALAELSRSPKLVITDSQAFACVAPLVPDGVALTSFSVLMACYKGDVEAFVEGAKTIDGLTENSRVLIAEACSHAPTNEDIGRVKLPAMLRRKVGAGLRVDVVGGNDFPDDLSPYDLVIHCGACMFTRRTVLSRLERSKAQSIPMTNYGIAIAHLTGIIGRVVMPSEE